MKKRIINEMIEDLAESDFNPDIVIPAIKEIFNKGFLIGTTTTLIFSGLLFGTYTFCNKRRSKYEQK